MQEKNAIVTDVMMIDGLVPVTDEELKTFRGIMGYDALVTGMVDAFNTAVTKIVERLDIMTDDNQTRLNEISGKLSELNMSIASASSANARQMFEWNNSVRENVSDLINVTKIGFNSIVKSTSDIKEAFNNVLHTNGAGSSTAPLTNLNEFKLVSTLSYTEIEKWRAQMYARVTSAAELYNIKTENLWLEIYHRMSKICGVNVTALRKIHKEFPSTLCMISRSDVLRQAFNKAYKSFLDECTLGKKSSRGYDSISAMKCPDEVKVQIGRYFGKAYAKGGDYRKFYDEYKDYRNINNMIESAKARTGYKHISPGFAIMLYPEGYKDLVAFVDNSLKERE